MKNLPLKFTAFSATVMMFLAATLISGQKAGSLTVTQRETAPEVIYTLSDYNGKLALYRNTQPEPIEVYNIFTDSLPEEEYLRVSVGISATTEEALQKLIEAYTS